jgi:hypothetical protein
MPNAGHVRCGGVGLWSITDEPVEQSGETLLGGDWGGKAGDQGELSTVLHAPDSEREKLHVPGVEGSTRSFNASTLFIQGRSPVR